MFNLRHFFPCRMEDGTLPYLDIIALNHGFDAIESLAGGMRRISARTFSLAAYTVHHLKALCHGNGLSAVDIYGWDEDESTPDNSTTHGATVTFNLRDSDGAVVGFAAVEDVAETFNLQLRTGCFCNTGACQKYLRLSVAELIANLQVWSLFFQYIFSLNSFFHF